MPGYLELLDLPRPASGWRLVSRDGVRPFSAGGRELLEVSDDALALLAGEAFRDISFLLRPAHNAQVAAILADAAASPNDRYMAWCLLENAAIAADFELPFCQDTGTACVIARKGAGVLTSGGDAAALAAGAARAYATENLRLSQLLPLDMYAERNSGDNLPAQADIHAGPGLAYDFLFIAKGGGSANRTALFQEAPALLKPEALKPFLAEKLRALGTSACPPYHAVFVIGGTSPETCLEAVKLGSAGALDDMPFSPPPGGGPFRDADLEAWLAEASRGFGPGAQFGGTHFVHDVRVFRLPRHAASLPIGLGVSCSADRAALGRIDQDGVWLEELDRDPARFLTPELRAEFSGRGSAVPVNLDRPMAEVRAQLAGLKPGTRLALSGRLIAARDAAHARFMRLTEEGKPLPKYLFDHPVYYAGPARQPAGLPCGSFGPTTAGRMDAYAGALMSRGAALVTLAKGGRSEAFRSACRAHGGFYLGSPGGPAALIARHIKSAKVIDYPDLGMEAVRELEVADMPAFLLMDDKGSCLYDR